MLWDANGGQDRYWNPVDRVLSMPPPPPLPPHLRGMNGGPLNGPPYENTNQGKNLNRPGRSDWGEPQDMHHSNPELLGQFRPRHRGENFPHVHDGFHNQGGDAPERSNLSNVVPLPPSPRRTGFRHSSDTYREAPRHLQSSRSEPSLQTIHPGTPPPPVIASPASPPRVKHARSPAVNSVGPTTFKGINQLAHPELQPVSATPVVAEDGEMVATPVAAAAQAPASAVELKPIAADLPVTPRPVGDDSMDPFGALLRNDMDSRGSVDFSMFNQVCALCQPRNGLLVWLAPEKS